MRVFYYIFLSGALFRRPWWEVIRITHSDDPRVPLVLRPVKLQGYPGNIPRGWSQGNLAASDDAALWKSLFFNPQNIFQLNIIKNIFSKVTINFVMIFVILNPQKIFQVKYHHQYLQLSRQKLCVFQFTKDFSS